MRVGLHDVDGHHFLNLPLMKLAAWHKQRGDEVEWYFPLMVYDRVYASKVFTWTPDAERPVFTNEYILRGTGTTQDEPLAEEVEHVCPDYSMYPEQCQNTAYGFMTRGCPRQCPFCIVSRKEGKQSRKVADLSEFWTGQKEVKLLDPNILACRERDDLLCQLRDSKVNIDFTQGLDARLMTHEIARIVGETRIKMVHFAWDLESEEEAVLRGLRIFSEIAKLSYRKQHCYVLSNFNTTQEYDLYRIYTLKRMGYDPYLMIYDRENAPQELRRMQRWCNNKFVFRACETFEQYRS